MRTFPSYKLKFCERGNARTCCLTTSSHLLRMKSPFFYVTGGYYRKPASQIKSSKIWRNCTHLSSYNVQICWGKSVQTFKCHSSVSDFKLPNNWQPMEFPLICGWCSQIFLPQWQPQPLKSNLLKFDETEEAKKKILWDANENKKSEPAIFTELFCVFAQNSLANWNRPFPSYKTFPVKTRFIYLRIIFLSYH